MTPAIDLLSIGGDALATYEETILDFGRYMRPPTMTDFPPTLAALIDLQRAFGLGHPAECSHRMEFAELPARVFVLPRQ